jgi:hypothetical protein
MNQKELNEIAETLQRFPHHDNRSVRATDKSQTRTILVVATIALVMAVYGAVHNIIVSSAHTTHLDAVSADTHVTRVTSQKNAAALDFMAARVKQLESLLESARNDRIELTLEVTRLKTISALPHLK